MLSTTNEKSGVAHFTENQKLFSNPKTEPEKFNLYGGFRNMATTIQEQGERIGKLEKQLGEALAILKRLQQEL